MDIMQYHFRIGISNSDSLIDVNLDPTTVQRGFKTLIKVKPSVTVSDNGVKSLSIEDRQCRFQDEIPDKMTLFQKYSPAACRFECMYQFRYSMDFDKFCFESFTPSTCLFQFTRMSMYSLGHAKTRWV